MDGTVISDGDVCAYSEMDFNGGHSYADSIGVITSGVFISHCNRDSGDLSSFSMRTDENPVGLEFHSTDIDGLIIDLERLKISKGEICISFADKYFNEKRDGLLKALGES